MAVEERHANIPINKAGGTAGPEGKSYRVVLPPTWAKQLGVTEGDREVLLQYDGECITIRRDAVSDYNAFLNAAQEKGHALLILHYYSGETLCTKICADKATHQLAIQNQVSDPLSTAFGVNKTPTWTDLELFLESRCVPRQRDGLPHYLAKLGLDKYDPLSIIRKTEGRMAEDACWLKILEG